MAAVTREQLRADGFLPQKAHWGAFYAKAKPDGALVIRPHPNDPNPSEILNNLVAAARHPARIARPAVRRGWLENGPGPDSRRGRDSFVEIGWDEAIKRLAAELSRVRGASGCGSIFGGSYGWSSAGRFHHAQSQVHRFLNATGGYVRSVNSYSSGAANVIFPHIICSLEDISRRCVTWDAIEANTELLVCFGGMASKNAAVAPGGASANHGRQALRRAKERGARFVLISPLRDDLDAELGALHIAIRPGTDTALMLALCHTLLSLGLEDRSFLARYCTGFDVFAAYLRGSADGQAKDTAWAASITGIAQSVIVDLAHEIARSKTLITVSQSLQRARHGEQPMWAALVLAALRGQIGLQGLGFNYGLGSMGEIGSPSVAVPLPTLPQGVNLVEAFIPVARIADMLLQPGNRFSYNGSLLEYPDIRLLYWAGGNPFHHHQDINRLRQAFSRPETVIVHESAWTATARHADIVLPATMAVERADIGAAPYDAMLIAMHRIIAPYGDSKDDYEIFSLLAAELGVLEAFTENRSVDDWLRVMYEGTRRAIAEQGGEAPDFDGFWADGELVLPTRASDGGRVAAFRRNPDAAPLPTPSGKIEIFSETIAGFGYRDCPGHPAWLSPVDAGDEGRYPLTLVTNQPASRLHSQLDFGQHSLRSKIHGREPMRISARDARKRGIRDHDLVRLFNGRGACLAAAVVDAAVADGVVQLSTGAWYDPDDAVDGQALCVHGNPNTLTRDVGTSALAQGCTGQLCRVEVERYSGLARPVRAFEPPV